MVNTSRMIAVYISLIAIVFIAGISGTYIIGHYESGFSVPINSLLEAAYFTVITVSTVGYGDIVPVTAAARIFVIVLVLVGIGVFLSTITFVSSELVIARAESTSGRLSPFEKRLLKNHVILVGGDSVNLRLAEKLKDKNERFIMISNNSEVAAEMRESGYKAYVADETNEDEMVKFEFDKAKSVIIDMLDKSKMAYAILVVRNLAEKSKIVVIAHSKDEEIHIRRMGAGVGVINPSEMVSNILSQKIEEL